MIIEGTNKNFDELTNNELVIVDFFATWCGPCRMLGPILEEISKERKIKIIKIDVDKEELLSRKFGIMSIPTIMFFKEGKIIFKQTGLTSKESLTKLIEENR